MTSEAPIKALILAELPELTVDSPKYTEAQNQLGKAEGAIKTEKGWWELPSGKLLVPEELAHTLVSQTHQATHLGHAACSQVNAASWVFRQKPSGIQLKGTLPFEHLGVDFTEMKRH